MRELDVTRAAVARDQGEVAGWVLVLVMAAGIAVAVFGVAAPALVDVAGATLGMFGTAGE